MPGPLPLAELLAQALYLALLLSIPPVAAAWLAGGLTSLVGSRAGATDPAVSAVPRAAAALLALAVSGAWMSELLVEFAASTLARAFSGS